jgi:peptide/nickel transport system substrate-binding protein
MEPAGRSIAIALFGCMLASGSASAAKRDNSVRFAYDQAPENVDPYFNSIRIGVIFGQQVWDTLICRDPDSGEYKGQLPAAWRQIDDRTIEFDLRQGVRFRDGEEFDADDVVYTLNFVSIPEKVVTQANVRWTGYAERVDKYKVRLTTKQVFPALIDYLAGPIVIHPNGYYEKVGPKGQNDKPVGSGPCRVAQHVRGRTLELNPDYFKDSPKGTPNISKVGIRFIPDGQTQLAELLSGGADFLMHVPKDQADQIKRMPNLQVVSGETMRIVFMQINTLETSPFPMLRDVRVRRTLNHAIDRERMVNSLVGEVSRIIHTICFTSQFGCIDEGTPRYEYDPQKAKQPLAEVGFPNGFEFLFLAYRERRQSEAIICYLQTISVKANIMFLQYAAMCGQVASNKAGLTHQTWGSFSVNDVSAATPNYFAFGAEDVTRDAEVRDLLDEGGSSVDPDVRKRAYKQALTLIAERAYAVPLYSLPVYHAVTADLVFTAYPDEMPRFWEMTWK